MAAQASIHAEAAAGPVAAFVPQPRSLVLQIGGWMLFLVWRFLALTAVAAIVMLAIAGPPAALNMVLGPVLVFGEVVAFWYYLKH